MPTTSSSLVSILVSLSSTSPPIFEHLALLRFFILFCLCFVSLSVLVNASPDAQNIVPRHAEHHARALAAFSHHQQEEPPAQGASPSSSPSASVPGSTALEHLNLHSTTKLAPLSLMVSVDGHIHALDRLSGDWIWSLHDPKGHYTPSPLVSSSPPNRTSSSTTTTTTTNTHHQDDSNNNNNNNNEEFYFIEPCGDGDIYLLHEDSQNQENESLVKLPLSVVDLVQRSPFAFPSDDTRIFVGLKHSTLLAIDLHSGTLLGTYDPHQAFCPSPDSFYSSSNTKNSDSDHSSSSSSSSNNNGSGAGGGGGGGTNNSKDRPGPAAHLWPHLDFQKFDPLFISRTEYTLSIYSRSKGLLQTLNYTAYGPSSPAFFGTSLSSELHNLHHDGKSIHSAHDGSLVCFDSSDPNKILWHVNHFSQPAASIYDILLPSQSSSPIQPLLLPQPDLTQQRLKQFVKHGHKSSSSSSSIPSLKSPSAYLGQLDSNHVYAFSSQNYPIFTLNDAHFDLPSIPSTSSWNKNNNNPSKPSSSSSSSSSSSLSSSSKSIIGIHPVHSPSSFPAVPGLDLDSLPPRLAIDPPSPSSSLTHPNNPSSSSSYLPSLEPPPPAIPANNSSFFSSSPSLSTSTSSSTITAAAAMLDSLSIFIYSLFAALFLSSSSSFKPWIVILSSLVSIWFGYVWATKRHHYNNHSLNNTTYSTTSPQTSSQSLPFETPSTQQNQIDYYNQTPPNQSINLPTHHLSPQQKASLNKALPDLPAHVVRDDDADAKQIEQEQLQEQQGDQNDNNKKKTKKTRRRGKKSGAWARQAAVAAETNNNKNTNEDTKNNNTEKVLPLNNSNTSTPSLVSDSDTSSQNGTGGNNGQEPELTVSSETLGYGSHGTIVLRGTFQGRVVAVKRLLKDFTTVAKKEVSLLQESDDHPNVIRYFCQSQRSNFLYIALELCPATLGDLIDRSQSSPELTHLAEQLWKDVPKAMRQIASGLAHLHSLKIIHRDIKPQNILVAPPRSSSPSASSSSPNNNKYNSNDDSNNINSNNNNNKHQRNSSTTSLSSISNGSNGTGIRLLISDFGLCKKLEFDESSFAQTTQHAAGSFGYRAPEVLRGEVDLNDIDKGRSTTASSSTTAQDDSTTIMKSNTSNKTLKEKQQQQQQQQRRLTKSIDIFSLGCLFFYVLTRGEHPFGSRFEREMNIMKNKTFMEPLDILGSDTFICKDLIEGMTAFEPNDRPTAESIMLHPFFWNSAKKLRFLCDSSDRFEVLEREPPAPPLVDLEQVQNGASTISSIDVILGANVKEWHKALDKAFLDNLGKYRKYEASSIRDLLRVLRNKKHHYQDMPVELRERIGSLPDGFLDYFTRRFPKLLVHIFHVVNKHHASEAMFEQYFSAES